MLQEVAKRFPGRIDAGETSFASVAELARAMRRAPVTHGVHEKEVLGGEYDVHWRDWYGAYMEGEQAGTPRSA